MKQQTLTGFAKHGKRTRRAQFLADLERIVPWPELVAEVAKTNFPTCAKIKFPSLRVRF
jgi:hypothetical protein